jgi:quinol monooxygenase YgiN
MGVHRLNWQCNASREESQVTDEPMCKFRSAEVTMIMERIAVLVAPERREDLRRAFSSLVEPTCVEPGCISCDFYQEAGNLNRFCLETRWSTDEELVRHLRSEQYRNLLKLLELSSEPPLVEFHDVVATKGLDLVRAVRQDRYAI